jgi:tripartite-type tricarboxylate transporter receptor subunit TctC
MRPLDSIRTVLLAAGIGGMLATACGQATVGIKPTAPPAAPTAAPAKPAAPAGATSPSASPAAASASPAASPAAKPVAAPARTFDERAVADFYRGKTVRIVLGLTPGSGADLTARLVAKYLPKYVPGNPGVIVENKPGGGGMLAANTVYNTEPKDGSVIAAPLEGFPLQQLLGGEGVQFDSRQFQWVGSLVKSQVACIARFDSGVNSIKDIMGTGKQLIVGSSGPGGTAHDAPTVLEAALGADFTMARFPSRSKTKSWRAIASH